jgi:hypothetical protein
VEVRGQFHAPAALPPGKAPLVLIVRGGWVDPRAGLQEVAKRKIPSSYRIIQPVVSAMPLPIADVSGESTHDTGKFACLTFDTSSRRRDMTCRHNRLNTQWHTRLILKGPALDINIEEERNNKNKSPEDISRANFLTV